MVYGGLGGKAQLDLQPTLRASKNSVAIRQFSIHTWDHLVEERRAGMRALVDMLAAGKLHPRIHARLPLTEAEQEILAYAMGVLGAAAIGQPA